jgi:HAD superfamily hydrolase (TIGR01509 family)
MKWNEKLFLFDLDGLLVDTERFHWQAYQEMCQQYGQSLLWDFDVYLQISGSSDTAIRERLFVEYPSLFEGRSWEEMYTTKSLILHKFLCSLPIPLMLGVEELLNKFSEESKRMVVVTHSSEAVVSAVRKSHPVFSKISTWISRAQYQRAKPAPDCYLLACSVCSVKPEDAVGFEDSLRGIQALVSAGCRPVLVNDRYTSHTVPSLKNVLVLRSLEELL